MIEFEIFLFNLIPLQINSKYLTFNIYLNNSLIRIWIFMIIKCIFQFSEIKTYQLRLFSIYGNKYKLYLKIKVISINSYKKISELKIFILNKLQMQNQFNLNNYPINNANTNNLTNLTQFYNNDILNIVKNELL
jgi:hypothetical protein